MIEEVRGFGCRGAVVPAFLFERFGSWTASFYGTAALAPLAAITAVGLRSMPCPSDKQPGFRHHLRPQ
jgi:hypothetical protein